jgi:hypothetical protein
MADLGGFGLGEEGSMGLIWVSSGLSWLVGVGLQIALLAVVLTAVRHHRRDAASWLLAAAVMGLVVSVIGPAVGWAGSFLGGELGIEAMLLVQAMLGIVGTVVHAVVFLLLLRGIVVLARPAL